MRNTLIWLSTLSFWPFIARTKSVLSELPIQSFDIRDATAQRRRRGRRNRMFSVLDHFLQKRGLGKPIGGPLSRGNAGNDNTIRI